MKVCVKCKENKKLSEFYIYFTKTGKENKKLYKSSCKKCILDYQKKRYTENHEHQLELRRSWQKNNPDKVKLYRDRFYKSHPGYSKLYQQEYTKRIRNIRQRLTRGEPKT